MTCQDCPYSALVGVSQRECRYDPPRLMMGRSPTGEQGFMPVSPPVASDHWCGKHPGFMEVSNAR